MRLAGQQASEIPPLPAPGWQMHTSTASSWHGSLCLHGKYFTKDAPSPQPEEGSLDTSVYLLVTWLLSLLPLMLTLGFAFIQFYLSESPVTQIRDAALILNALLVQVAGIVASLWLCPSCPYCTVTFHCVCLFFFFVVSAASWEQRGEQLPPSDSHRALRISCVPSPLYSLCVWAHRLMFERTRGYPVLSLDHPPAHP